MKITSHQEVRQVNYLVYPGKNQNQTEAEAFVPQNLRPTFLNVHETGKTLEARGSRAAMHLRARIYCLSRATSGELAQVLVNHGMRTQSFYLAK